MEIEMDKKLMATEITPGVTVEDLLKAFNYIMDGNDNFHNIVAITGLKDETVRKILEVYSATSGL
jgi:hypothetical protein